ncbi:MAG: A24 family peptidase, partial [Sphingomonas bacterium]|nr:A24 family peptidase [Sphingomonas bacterium]
LATLILRWPAGEQVTRGRSRCDGCARTLAPIELVPLLSRWMLGGKCRSCGAVIDLLHARVELVAALVGAIALGLAPDASGLALAAFGWLLIPSCWLDWRHFWLPDRLTLLLALAGLAGGSWLGGALLDRLIGGAVGWGTLAAVGFAYRRLRQREGLGRGDPKLFGAVGLWLGWVPLAPILALAAALGLAIALRKGLASRDPIAFGPMIGMASWIAAAVLLAARLQTVGAA